MALYKLRCGRRVAFVDGSFDQWQYAKIEGISVMLFGNRRRGRLLTKDDVVEESTEILIKTNGGKKEAARFFSSITPVKKGVMWRRKGDPIIRVQQCEFAKNGICSLTGKKCQLEKKGYCLM